MSKTSGAPHGMTNAKAVAWLRNNFDTHTKILEIEEEQGDKQGSSSGCCACVRLCKELWRYPYFAVTILRHHHRLTKVTTPDLRRLAIVESGACP